MSKSQQWASTAELGSEVRKERTSATKISHLVDRALVGPISI